MEQDNAEIYVQIYGAVKNPGLYKMKYGDRIDDLLTEAEVEEYNQKCINLAQKLVDEQNLYVPTKNESCEEQAIKENGVVNINIANTYELQTLSGIGESKANAIIKYREQNGTFQTKEDLLNVDGINEGLVTSLQDNISLY